MATTTVWEIDTFDPVTDWLVTARNALLPFEAGLGIPDSYLWWVFAGLVAAIGAEWRQRRVPLSRIMWFGHTSYLPGAFDGQ